MQTNQELINEMFDALNARDAEALGSFYSDDCEIVAPPGELRGREAVTALAGVYWDAFSDLKWRTVSQVTAGETVVTEEILEGTHDGPLVLPHGTIPASRGRLETRVCEVARVQDGQITSLHLYWDNMAFLRAVGVAER